MSSDFKVLNQPRGFKYPFREFGKTKIVRRCFQQWLYDVFSWLDYEENKDVVFCHICRKADQSQQLNVQSKKSAFIKSGFSNWKDALNKFRSHEKSTCHHVAIEVVTQKTLDVAEMLSKEHEVEKKHNRRMFI